MKVIVLGAGVDAELGMPLTCELIPRIGEFLHTNEGATFDTLVRSCLPRLFFRFDDFITKTIDKFADDFNREMAEIKDRVSEELNQNENLNENERKLGRLIIIIMDKMSRLRAETTIDDVTVQLIRDVFGDIDVGDASIIDYNKLVYTDTFKAVLKSILQRSLQNSKDPILRHVYKNLLDIEQLMLKYFVGFYLNKEGYEKTYLYIVWLLWAYIVIEEKRITNEIGLENFNRLPIYSQLHGNDWSIITFNYTTFAKQFVPDNSYYFHGSVADYIDIETKTWCHIDDDTYSSLDVSSYFQDNIMPNICFDSANRHCTIPIFIPPVKIKPVIDTRFIQWWSKSEDALIRAEKIVIVGYSFNASDDHFNALLKECQKKPIFVVDTDVHVVKERLSKVLNINIQNAISGVIQEKPVLKIDNLTLIEAKASEIDYNAL